MSKWEDVEDEVPELAVPVRERFEKFTLGVLATLRRDGSPRVTGIEPGFSYGELWLGMMEHSRKGDDLRRDGRLALHSAGTDKEASDPDAKLAGVAVEVLGEAKDRYCDDVERERDWRPKDFLLFKVDVRELVRTYPEGDKLVIESWHQGIGARRVARD
jgi:hypothetical protein